RMPAPPERGWVVGRTFLSAWQTGMSAPPPGLLVHDRIEDADLLPVVLVLLDELLVAGVLLVLIVGRLVLEDQVQSDVEVAVVDVAVEVLAANASGEVDGAIVIGQVLLAGLNKLLLRLVRVLLEGEVNHVSNLTYTGILGALRLLQRAVLLHAV